MDASVVSQVQRKIELQSPEDLSYLVGNVRGTARALVREAFPQEGEDELRTEIEELVNEYINSTFALAAPNLSINGLSISWADFLVQHQQQQQQQEAYEPFDARKRQRVADLIAQEEKLLEQVAALKRSVPGPAAALHAQVLEDAARRDELLVQQRTEQVLRQARDRWGKEKEEGGEGEGDKESWRITDLERQSAVEDGFRDAVGKLGRLKRDMPALVAKMERARVAGEYVRDAKS
ncbi:Kinetochore Mis14 [Moelleriella libera RCEF 2490]|uniref:Kinetochore Mis14 n=1 Tax=Moelleriella libera RCEF 2490 TaxID=1081109 RepID=A0A167ZAX5_9HYPO|nr:Kinetochore Mis14 [Moelleriella libera RCEF 2490]